MTGTDSHHFHLVVSDTSTTKTRVDEDIYMQGIVCGNLNSLFTTPASPMMESSHS
jgi:hypothetical protein